MLCSLLIASSVSAIPYVQSGRYSGTATISHDDFGCINIANCRTIIPLNFSFRASGSSGLYVGQNGHRERLTKYSDGRYISSVPYTISNSANGVTCISRVYLNLLILNGRPTAGIYQSIDCTNGVYGFINWLAYLRRLR